MSPRLQDIATELAQLRAILAASQAQSALAQHRAEVLSATNARLRRKLQSLSKQVERVRQTACHDELTGLPDRALLVDRIQQAMGQALRVRKRVALVLLNLEGFNGLNEKFGRGTADRLLYHVARVLTSSVRGSDTVCRYGGAEFVLILPGMNTVNDAETVVQRIRAHLAGSFLLNVVPTQMTVDVGLAHYPGDGRDCVELLNHADIALHRERAGSVPVPAGHRATGAVTWLEAGSVEPPQSVSRDGSVN
ncbi:MAG: GGDEF domain-containing protein [Gammaproteobacteria bacterium]|nr:GGDEF domain-containing protein [Gammaproteobacteria bacterium]